MADVLSRSQREARYIYDMAPVYDQRTGQFLFNSLKHEIADLVRGTTLDTFYREMTYEQITQWLEEHIVYGQDGTMIRLFDGDDVLWEEAKHG